MYLGTCYLLVFVLETSEYHSWVYFLNFLQTTEHHSYLYTRESNNFYLFLCMFCLRQAKIIMLNFEHQILCFHVPVVTLSCWICPLQVGKMPSLWNLPAQICFYLNLYTVCCNFSIWKWSKIFFASLTPFVVKLGLGCKGQIIFEIQILQILP